MRSQDPRPRDVGLFLRIKHSRQSPNPVPIDRIRQKWITVARARRGFRARSVEPTPELVLGEDRGVVGLGKREREPKRIGFQRLRRKGLPRAVCAGKAGLQRPWTWAVAAAAVVAGFALVIYNQRDSSDEWVLLDNPSRPTVEQAQRIQEALAAADVEARIENGRILAPRSKLLEARALIAKKKLGATSVAEIWNDVEEVNLASLFEGSASRQQRIKRATERSLALKIGQFDDAIISADVLISKSEARSRRLYDAPKIQISVLLDTKDNRSIEPSTVEAISTLLLSSMPGLTHDGITLMDRDKRQYLVAGKPHVTRTALARARMHEIANLLRENLAWITGVHVTVNPRPTAEGDEVDALVEGQSQGGSATAVLINKPLSLDSPGPAKSSSAVGVSRDSDPLEMARKQKANILILVPRGHYVRAFREVDPSRDPSTADLKPFQARVEAAIRSTIEYAVPAAERGELKIETIPEEAAVVAVAPPVETETERTARAWRAAAIGLGAAGAFAIGVLTFWSFAGKSRGARLKSKPSRTAAKIHGDQGSRQSPWIASEIWCDTSQRPRRASSSAGSRERSTRHDERPTLSINVCSEFESTALSSRRGGLAQTNGIRLGRRAAVVIAQSGHTGGEPRTASGVAASGSARAPPPSRR